MSGGLFLLFVIIVLGVIMVSMVNVLQAFPEIGAGICVFCVIIICVLIGIDLKQRESS